MPSSTPQIAVMDYVDGTGQMLRSSEHRSTEPKGSCYFNLKQYEKASADFTEAIKREPMKGENYLHRGYCRKALGQDEDAAADFEKAESLGENK